MPADERRLVSSRKHPTESQLNVYSSGHGTESFRAAIEKHVQSCRNCLELLQPAQEARIPNFSDSDSVSSISEVQPILKDLPAGLMHHPQYAIERELGRGGMGIVYLVRHKLTGRREALKVLMPSLVERHDIRIRFIREIQAAAQLDHPNICRTLNAFQDGELLGLVMEYLPGSDLAQVVNKYGPLSVRTACSLAIQLCEGLQHACGKGMIHRDIKPGNLMVDKTPQGLRLKILDFGLARGLIDQSPDQKDLTVDGRVLGTPEFMSPEQAISPSNVDIRSDLYSVGCTLYFMLSGSPPFQGETMFSIIQSHIGKPATPLPAINPKIPESLWAIVSSLLQKDPSLRPNSPADVARLLTPFVTSATEPQQSKPPTRVKSNDVTADPLTNFTRPILVHRRKQKRQKSSFASWVPIFLPTIAMLVAAVFFRAEILTEWKRLSGPGSSLIMIEQMPADADIWINDQKTSFARPNANSPAQITALPGTYKISVKRRGETMQEQTVQVAAGRDVRLTVAPFDSKKRKPGTSESPRESDRDTPTPEKPNIPRESFPTPEAVLMAISDARKAIHNRDGNAAISALAPMFNERGELRLRDFQPESGPVRQLQKFASALVEFNQKLASSISKRKPNETVFIGQIRYTFVGSTQTEINVLQNSEEKQFKTAELPVDVEQCLVDLELDHEIQYSKLVKAVGVFSHPKRTKGECDQARKWIKAATDANFITKDFEQLVDEFASDAQDSSEVLQRPSSHTLGRRLAGAEGEIGALFLLPPNVPFPKQASLLASVLGASARGDSTSPFWNVDTGEIGQRKPISGPLWACEVSNNGRLMVTFGATSPQTNLRIYALPVTNPMYQLSDLDDQRSAITLSADGRFLAACSVDETFIRWNLQAKSVVSKMVSKQPIGRDSVAAIALRATMDIVTVASRDGSVHAWRTSDGSELSTNKEILVPVKAMRFNRSGDRLVVVREDGTLELRDLDLKLLQTFKGHSAPLTSVGFSMKGRYLVTADCYNNVRMWDTDELKIEAAFNVDDSSEITAVTADAVGDLVAVGHQDSAIELWRKK